MIGEHQNENLDEVGLDSKDLMIVLRGMYDACSGSICVQMCS